jgi:hypothetical protein
VSGAPETVQAELLTFGFLDSRSAIIHRTVRWVTGLSGVPADYPVCQRSNDSSATVDCNGHLQKRYSPKPLEGAPDSEQCLSSAAPNCPVPQVVRAPTVETVRTLTVG